MKIILACLLSVACFVTATSDSARLIATKKVQNTYLVEGQDILVEYNLYNVGNLPALNVQLTDASFGPESFDIVAGRVQVKFDRIPPGANVSHSVVVRANQYGYFNFTAAEVSYIPSEDSQNVQIGYTSAPGEGAIVPLKEFKRRFSAHLIDWIIYCAFLVPVIVTPYAMWNQINVKYGLTHVKSS